MGRRALLLVLAGCAGLAPGALAADEAGEVPAVGNTVSREAILRQRPRYPAKAMKEGREGRVVARVRVTPQGDVAEVVIRESAGEDFDEVVVTALRAWKFNPSPAGSGEDAWVQVPVVFKSSGPLVQQGSAGALPSASGIPFDLPDARAPLGPLELLPEATPAAAQAYARACVAHIVSSSRVVYPFGDDRRRYGTAQVRLAVQGNGELHSVELVRSSRLPALDDALLTTLWMSAPLPAPPAEALQSADGLSIVTTFHYIGEWQPAGDYEVRGYRMLPRAERPSPLPPPETLQPVEQAPPAQHAPAAGEALAPAQTPNFVTQIRNRIRSNLQPPPGDFPDDTSATFGVEVSPQGEVQSVSLLKSSGAPAVDAAIERAIWRASPLPGYGAGKTPTETSLHLVFCPFAAASAESCSGTGASPPPAVP